MEPPPSIFHLYKVNWDNYILKVTETGVYETSIL